MSPQPEPPELLETVLDCIIKDVHVGLPVFAVRLLTKGGPLYWINAQLQDYQHAIA